MPPWTLKPARGIDEPMDDLEDTQARARALALKLLSRRFQSTRRLTGELTAAGYEDDTVEEVVAYLKSCGYLDDKRLVDGFVERAKREFRGPLWLDQQLAQEGLSAPVSTDGRTSLERAERELAKCALLTRHAPPLNQAEARRASQYLTRRGFTADTIQSVVADAFEPD